MKNYLFDENQTRYQLAASFDGKPYNWLFFPGGPGADSAYFEGLIELLKLPGNSWLVDLPGNGSNTEGISLDYDFDKWISLFVTMAKQFNHPVMVGHSAGAMFPLLLPQLEEYLKGFVILNSAPSLWLEAAVNYSKQFQLPDLSQEMAEFTLNPNQQTFDIALGACLPYYFPAETLEEGRALLKDLPFQFLPAVWWQRKVIQTNFDALWIPENVPTLIINSTRDCICPYTLYANDKRFNRPNIERKVIEGAGHMPWVEKPELVKTEFRKFTERLL